MDVSGARPHFPVNIWNMNARVKNNLHRTNNNLEAWHRKLNCSLQCTHPTLWTFSKKLIKEENNVHSDVINAMSVHPPRKRKHNSINTRRYNLVHNPHMDVNDQLKYIGRLLSLSFFFFSFYFLFFSCFVDKSYGMSHSYIYVKIFP